MVNQPVWICLGLGVDSVAMTIEMVRRGERIDLITFADTGEELPRTYAYLPIMNAFLARHGYPQIIVVHVVNRQGDRVTLGGACDRNVTLPALAFGWHTCSIRFKIEPQVKFAKKFQPFIDAWARGEKVIRCIGYDASPADTKRACRPTAQFPDLAEFQNRFPLREWGWSRERCIDEILREGLPNPGKSACYFCPARTKAEIAAMKLEYPEYHAKALALEQRAIDGGKLKKTKGLGRRFAWKDLEVKS